MASALGSTVPLVGASGAIAGLLGAYVILFPRVKIFVVLFFVRLRLSAWFFLGGWVLMNVGLGSAASLEGPQRGGVAWWAHVGGFVAGALWAIVFRRRILAPP